MRTIVEFAALLALAAGLGVVSGFARRPPVPGRLPDAFFRVASGARPLLLAQARDRIDAGGLVIVDTRDEAAFAEGHLPGAILLPAARWQETLPAVSLWLQGAPILLYGTAANVLGPDQVAQILRGQGFGPLFVLVDGFDGWSQAGLPVAAGREGVLDADSSPFYDDGDGGSGAPVDDEGSDPPPGSDGGNDGGSVGAIPSGAEK